jgi:hypothetical protein
MSLSDRQRRGAFKVCWSDTEFVVAIPFGVVPSKPAVPSKSVVPPTSVPQVPPTAVPRVLPSEPSALSTPSRVPHDSPPGPAVPETTAGHTRDTRHSNPLRRPSVHAPAPARASVPPSGGCPAARHSTSQPPVSARPSVPRRHTLVSRALSPPASPTLLSIGHTSASPGRLPHAERDRLPARVQSCPSRLQPRATPTCASSLLGNADQQSYITCWWPSAQVTTGSVRGSRARGSASTSTVSVLTISASQSSFGHESGVSDMSSSPARNTQKYAHEIRLTSSPL